MVIYRVTTEYGFEDKVLDSALFSDRSKALVYAKELTNERRGKDEYYMCCVAVDALTPNYEGEFQPHETLICHEL